MKIKFPVGAMLLTLFSHLSFAQVASSFSWMSRHGKNYTTTPKDQLVQIPCHVFASVSGIEAMYKIYFNRPDAAIDLSEQNLWTGCTGNNGGSTTAYSSLSYAQTGGVVNESCYPYLAHFTTPSDCNALCTSPSEKVTIAGFEQVIAPSADELKRQIIKYGPLVIALKHPALHNNNGHGYLLVGWTKSGSTTSWQLLDSWPTSASEPYVNRLPTTTVDLPSVSSFTAWRILPIVGNTKMTSLTASTPIAEDRDGDGFYNWGIGPKPAGASYRDEPDGDDSNRTKGPMDADGNISDIVDNTTMSLSASDERGFCPGKSYTVTASALGATEFRFSLSGPMTQTATTWNSVTFTITGNSRYYISVTARKNSGPFNQGIGKSWYPFCSPAREAVDPEGQANDDQVLIYTKTDKPQLTVELADKTDQIKSILLLNELGQAEQRITNINQGWYDVDFRQYSKLYFLTVQTRKKVITRKLIIKQ